jgi:hypothetical protein
MQELYEDFDVYLVLHPAKHQVVHCIPEWSVHQLRRKLV